MEIIIKEGKVLEEVLETICNDYNVTKDDFYYHYTEKKNGLFNKNTTVEVKAYLKKDLLEYTKEYLEELLTNMGLKVNFETKLYLTGEELEIFEDSLHRGLIEIVCEVQDYVLDDVEREYLRAVIKPFRKHVEYISKVPILTEEYITIELDSQEYIFLPKFKKGKMYKGLVSGIPYPLEELGL